MFRCRKSRVLQPGKAMHNDPKDAAACGFPANDPTKLTPFNGEHKAGPFAMISVPDSRTQLGPLCTDADSSHPGRCNP